MERRDPRTQTSAFGVGRREGHDASAFYARFTPPALSDDEHVERPAELIEQLGRGAVFHASATHMSQLPDNSVALVVTSPPYFVGKEYELAVTGHADGRAHVPESYLDYLQMLRDVFAECARVLEPGGRIAVNVANLGRKPYRSLSADVIRILQDDLGLLLRGEVIWEKSISSSGSCAWGSFARASNPVLRDLTERVVIASKGRFARAISVKDRQRRGLPHVSTMSNDEFLDVTKDVWRIDAESAKRVGHPAPFPVELPRRLIDLYTYVGDIVLDPFAGSGTSLVAAARTGRIGVGYDTDPAYVELAQQRLESELSRLDALEGRPLVALRQEDRQEHFQALAVEAGRNVLDIARARLEDAGFAEIVHKPRHPSGLVEADFHIAASGGARWWVHVEGGFTSSRPGLQRSDALWRLLGHIQVLGAVSGDPVLVLTSNLPKPGSPGDRAIRAVGPNVVFDAIELFDHSAHERLRHYAAQSVPGAVAGYWTERELNPEPPAQSADVVDIFPTKRRA